eukprot:6401368-Amphidinium_carterae.1
MICASSQLDAAHGGQRVVCICCGRLPITASAEVLVFHVLRLIASMCLVVVNCDWYRVLTMLLRGKTDLGHCYVRVSAIPEWFPQESWLRLPHVVINGMTNAGQADLQLLRSVGNTPEDTDPIIYSNCAQLCEVIGHVAGPEERTHNVQQSRKSINPLGPTPRHHDQVAVCIQSHVL